MFFVRPENPEPPAAAEILGEPAASSRGGDPRRTDRPGVA